MDDERHDPSLEKLLDIRLYDQWGEMPRSSPEERAMRYLAVCMSMLVDRVEDLEEGNDSSTKRIAEVEGSMGALEVQQAKLNDKVTLLAWDFNLNLKYWSQVVNFEAQMLSFGLTDSVMDRPPRMGSARLTGPGDIRSSSRLDFWTLGADPYLPSRHIESFLRVFKHFACIIPRG